MSTTDDPLIFRRAPAHLPRRQLRAFALARLPEASEAERAEALAAGRPGAPGECDHLAVAWPELAAFLRERGLAKEKPSPAR